MKERIIATISAIVLVAALGFVWRTWYVDYHGFLDQVGGCKDDYYKESRKSGIRVDMTDKEVWDSCVNIIRGSNKG